MKVLVLTGSPHKEGTTATLANAFIKGAREAGHEVSRFDAAFARIHPCMACGHCREAASEGCVFKDDMQSLNPKLFEADAIVFVSPVWYFSMSSHLRIAIDRFYANDSRIRGAKKALLILGMASTVESVPDGAIASFKGMCNWLEWEESGIVAARGCCGAADIKEEQLDAAYRMGLNLA